jgi:hypothetical protein
MSQRGLLFGLIVVFIVSILIFRTEDNKDLIEPPSKIKKVFAEVKRDIIEDETNTVTESKENKSEIIKRNIVILQHQIQSGNIDKEKLASTIKRLRDIGRPVLAHIESDLKELSWSDLAKRRNNFYLIGLLKIDGSVPVIDSELEREDHLVTFDDYRSKLNLQQSNEGIKDYLQHHGIDIRYDADNQVRVTYESTQVAALQALAMLRTPESKLKLRQVASNQVGKIPLRQRATQLFLEVASSEERETYLEEYSVDYLKKELTPADFKKYFPTHASF